MEATKLFELFYDALKDEYKSYVEDVVKSVGLLVVAIGWMMTSDGARTFLGDSKANGLALICTVILATCNVTVCIGHHLRSKRIKQQILICDSEAGELVANYFLRPAHIVLNAVTIVGLYVLLFLLIAFVRR